MSSACRESNRGWRGTRWTNEAEKSFSVGHFLGPGDSFGYENLSILLTLFHVLLSLVFARLNSVRCPFLTFIFRRSNFLCVFLWVGCSTVENSVFLRRLYLSHA
jgi:hypothetical protein